jgi:hypothetical protein
MAVTEELQVVRHRFEDIGTLDADGFYDYWGSKPKPPVFLTRSLWAAYARERQA